MTPRRSISIRSDELGMWNSTLPNPVFTIGHSTRTVAELVVLLQQVNVDMLVDVRSMPRSRAMPQFNTDVLPEALGTEGIGYRTHHGRWNDHASNAHTRRVRRGRQYRSLSGDRPVARNYLVELS